MGTGEEGVVVEVKEWFFDDIKEHPHNQGPLRTILHNHTHNHRHKTPPNPPHFHPAPNLIPQPHLAHLYLNPPPHLTHRPQIIHHICILIIVQPVDVLRIGGGDHRVVS